MNLDYFQPEPDGLFNQPPLARASDPKTSHEAADKLIESGRHRKLLERVVDLVRRFPNCTTRELGTKSDLSEHDIGRRVGEAATMGLVIRGDPRECTVTRRNAATWRIVG